MSEYYMNEKEQIAELKNILKRYGMPVIIGVILAIAINFAWRAYQTQQIRQAELASSNYDRLLTAVKNNEQTQINKLTTKLIKDHPSSSYTDLAQLILAKKAIEQKKYLRAEAALQWVVKHSDNNSIKQLAQFRLERVLLFNHKKISQKKYFNKPYQKLFNSLT